ncbi:MAG: sigma-54-dependent Fis family transcriptional regulator [Nitrospirae bacterium]|nr:sigma-54-dependent Fis family transcriptional regulator [Nitrospirota bacterium]
MHKILVVDDEAKIRKNICEILTFKGFTGVEASGGREAVECFTREQPAAVLLDLRMPDMDGMETLQRLRQIDTSIPVVIVTAHSDIRSAVEAVKQGAYDFLPKPPDFEHLIITLNRAIEKSALERRVTELDETLHASLESTLGRSNAMRKIIRQLPRIAASNFSLLIQGETGTGKTYMANLIHAMSLRAKGAFVKVSIGSLQDSVVESELFGHEKGSFTGAERPKIGYFEAADGGTLLIDDLDNISSHVQGKLLGILDDKQVLRVGSTVNIALNIRIIGATNKDLLKCVSEGKFREDLFFRLSEVTIQIPPLRERVEDIAFFARKFFLDACAELDCPASGPVRTLPEDVIERLQRYPWPGNLRQLKNVMKRAALLVQGDALTPGELESLIGPTGENSSLSREAEMGPVVMSMKDAEKMAILKALAFSKGHKTKAASLLEIDFKTLARKMQEYGISN